MDEKPPRLKVRSMYRDLLAATCFVLIVLFVIHAWMRHTRLRRGSLSKLDRVGTSLGGQLTPEIPSDFLGGLNTLYVGWVRGSRPSFENVIRWGVQHQRVACVFKGRLAADIATQHLLFGWRSVALTDQCFRLSGKRIAVYAPGRSNLWLREGDPDPLLYDCKDEPPPFSVMRDVAEKYFKVFAANELKDDIVCCDGWIVIVGPIFFDLAEDEGELREYLERALALAESIG